MDARSGFLFGMLTASVLLLGGCATEGTTGSGGAASSSGSASGAQANSLKTCLDRVSSGASAGARQVAEESCRDNEALRLAIVGAATTKSGDRAASGTQGDSLDACMGRIPKDATSGQRMLAEESCRRDQAALR